MVYYGAVGENENICLEEPIKKIEQSELHNETWVLWNGTNYSTTFNTPQEYEQHVSELTKHVSFYDLIIIYPFFNNIISGDNNIIINFTIRSECYSV